MFIFEGFIIGLVGSLHCLGMCGPLVLALPLSHASGRQRLLGGILYNLGRAVTYAALGVLFGLLGKTLQIFGLLSGISVAFGIVLILSVLLPGMLNISAISARISNTISQQLKQRMGKLLKQQKVLPLFIFGLLNGLLPCGLVYGAILAAIVAGSLLDSSLFMFFFGLGTLPLMFLLLYFADLLKSSFLSKLRGIVPVFIVALGILFILRGLNLGIPYLSPDMEKVTQMKLHHDEGNMPAEENAGHCH